MTLLGRIDELRAQQGKISINRLEKECGLTRGSMSKWDDHAPSAEKVKKVADYFGVSVEYLLHGKTPANGTKKDPSLSTEALDPAVIQLMEEVKTLPPELLDLVANYVRDAKKIYRGTK